MDNAVVFMAYDTAGNMAISDTMTIWVNRPPEAVILDPNGIDPLRDDEKVFLSAEGSNDPDDDLLNLTWYLDDDPSPIAYGSEASLLLPAGHHNITLVAIDDMGAEDRTTREVTVEHIEPSGTEETPYHIVWSLVLLAVIAGVILASLYWVRRRREDGAENEG